MMYPSTVMLEIGHISDVGPHTDMTQSVSDLYIQMAPPLFFFKEGSVRSYQAPLFSS